MTKEDGVRWDVEYSGSDEPEQPGIPALFAPYEDLFPRTGFALDLACGSGRSSVWLARLGLDVLGVDISAAAVTRARRLAARHELSGRCRFEVADLKASFRGLTVLAGGEDQGRAWLLARN
jgi:tRNA/tmRNA/rRNA uracil-C5-methylase (TrmA/RlmC/RlmD family)